MTQNESVPPATNPEPPSGWSFLPDNWEKFLQWVKNTFGLRGFVAALIIVVLFLCWWQWPTIRTLPGVGGLLAWFTRKRLKKADPKQFSVGIAMLEGDVDGAHRRRLFAAMEGLQGVQVLPLDRTITREGNDLQAGVQAGHEQARRHLQKCGAHVLIWGTVLKHDGRTAPKLYWTASQELRSPAPMRESYLIAEDLSLPELFWEDLAQVLQLVVAARAGEFTKLQGTFIADRLKPLIAQVRGLLDARPRPRGWTNESIAEVRFLFAGALYIYGQQTGRYEPVEEAVAAYREALTERTRERVPLDWARTQNNLGAALSTLGKRESGTGRLEQAVAAYREALKEYTRERVPLDWAATLNNLGVALSTLGERESGTARSEEAVGAYREALKERTRDRVPLDWAMTQSNLGNALSALGVRESGTARLEHGVAAYREALKEFTRERVPLQWAGTQNNLGNALCSLGKLESGTARLEESVAALRDALQEYTRERVPLQWATTQYNLGLALREFGLRTNQPSVVCEALECFLSARRVFREASHDGASNAEYGIQTILSELHERFDDRTYQECYSHHAAELREIPGGRNPE
jgi:tetratricopeptide (TPR) repeat protein